MRAEEWLYHHTVAHAPRFADDIDLIDIDRRAVEEAYAPLKRETARIGLTINSTRTKYMIAGRDSGVSAEVVIDGDVFEVVEEFVYLGTLGPCDNQAYSARRVR